MRRYEQVNKQFRSTLSAAGHEELALQLRIMRSQLGAASEDLPPGMAQATAPPRPPRKQSPVWIASPPSYASNGAMSPTDSGHSTAARMGRTPGAFTGPMNLNADKNGDGAV